MTDVSSDVANSIKFVPWKPRYRLLLESLAGLFWFYSVIKLFVFDVDVWLVTATIPSAVWVLNYKLPIILSLIVIAMLITRSSTLALSTLYIIFYPLILLFWKIPRFIWRQKSWLLAFTIINAGISVFQSFKRDFTLATVFLIGAVLSLWSDNGYFLLVSILSTLTILVFAYAHAFVTAFKPSAVFQVYARVFPQVRGGNFLKMEESLKTLPVAQLDAKQLVDRTTALQNAVLYNRVCLLISKKLRDYQKSRVNVISYIISLVGLLIFTIVAFGFIDLALFKVFPGAYRFEGERHSTFVFFYYSAGSMFYATNGLTPVLPVAQLFQMFQFLFAVFLLIIFITIIITMMNERYAAELNEVVTALEKESQSVEGLIRSDFRIEGIAAAIEALQAGKAGLISVILFISKDLDEMQ
ncbi:MAG: hypothetical protein GC190_03115 [Alphaproteobacteria bacterium]|nr:hypothetical protein [Alphaproteobacteria bacterium]